MRGAGALDPGCKGGCGGRAGGELGREAFGEAAGASGAGLRRWPDSHTAVFTLGQALYNLVFVRHGLGEQGTEMDEISQQAAVALPRVTDYDRRLSLCSVFTGPVTFINPEASDDLLTWEDSPGAGQS